MKKTSRAGVSDTRAGLQPAGLYSSAGLFKKGFQDFHPLDASPYLLFDARTSMVGTLENPTLDLDPSKPETLDVITATRAGVATYTDADGNIQSASPDTVRVDHVQGEELTPTKYQRIHSTDFTSNSWSSVRAIITAGSGFEGEPSVIFEHSPSSGSAFYRLSAVATDSTKLYTFSFYVRRISGTGLVSLSHTSSPSGSNTYISINETWTRYETTVLGGAIAWGISLGEIGDTVEISKPQLEDGETLTTFTPNTTGSPKFITGATYGPRVPMILVEPSATNLVEYSEDFSNSYWTKTDVTVSAAPVAAPDGTMTATHVTSTGDNSILYKGGFQSGQTLSIWARTASGSGTCYFHYQVGGTPITVTDQWQRFEVPLNNDNAYVVNLRGGATLDEIYIWGAQIEQGSVATSYIPTSGSTVTRQADNLVISGSDFTDFYNNSEGTIYCEFEYDFEPAYEYIYNIQQDGNNEIRNQFATSSNVRTRYVAAGVNAGQTSVSGALQGSLNRHAFSYKTNNFRSSVNGGSEAEDLTGTASLSPIELQIGGRGSGISNIKFKRLIYWPYSSENL